MANINTATSRGGTLAALSTPRATTTPNRQPPSSRPSASARRNNVATPHGRAAIRAMDQRRAALFTPGRTRRRSLREQRETPRDLLRNLSRVLAPSSQVVSSSSSPESGANTTLSPLIEDDGDDDDDFPIDVLVFLYPLGPKRMTTTRI